MGLEVLSPGISELGELRRVGVQCSRLDVSSNENKERRSPNMLHQLNERVSSFHTLVQQRTGAVA